MAPAPVKAPVTAEEEEEKEEKRKKKEEEKETPSYSRRDAKPEKQLLQLPSSVSPLPPPTSLFAMASSQTLASPPDFETLGRAISSQRRRR